ncbi:MAG: helix-turn-helix domain-containing protein [Defluviitaleaceae bacterium]|nr:helix-turn-helix domain-containing protein [Defluviitaleaceae bacterium]
MPDTLGVRIKNLRLAKKLTQSDVVGCYMTRNMLSKIENGSATPSVRTLEYLAAVLGVPVGYLLDERKAASEVNVLKQPERVAKLAQKAVEFICAGNLDSARDMLNNIIKECNDGRKGGADE